MPVHLCNVEVQFAGHQTWFVKEGTPDWHLSKVKSHFGKVQVVSKEEWENPKLFSTGIYVVSFSTDGQEDWILIHPKYKTMKCYEQSPKSSR